MHAGQVTLNDGLELEFELELERMEGRKVGRLGEGVRI